jgi:hypothetical protein
MLRNLLSVFAFTTMIDHHGHSEKLQLHHAKLVAQTQSTLHLRARGAFDPELSHGELMHVMIISDRFDSFTHLHPRKENDAFIFEHSFAHGGRFLIAVDYSEDGKHSSQTFLVDVERNELPLDVPKAAPQHQTDENLTEDIGPYTVKLDLPDALQAGSEQSLAFHISFNGSPAKDLMPYYQAPMHVAFVSDDLSVYMHEHGTVGASHHGHHAPVPDHFGPNIRLHVTFPRGGKYHVFAQFKHAERVIVSHFLVQVR